MKIIKMCFLAIALQCTVPANCEARPINTKVFALLTACSILFFTGEQTRSIAGVQLDKTALAALAVFCFGMAYVCCPQGRQ